MKPKILKVSGVDGIRFYKEEKGKTFVSEDNGMTWMDLEKHMKEEHPDMMEENKMKKQNKNQDEIDRAKRQFKESLYWLLDLGYTAKEIGLMIEEWNKLE